MLAIWMFAGSLSSSPSLALSSEELLEESLLLVVSVVVVGCVVLAASLLLAPVLDLLLAYWFVEVLAVFAFRVAAEFPRFCEALLSLALDLLALSLADDALEAAGASSESLTVLSPSLLLAESSL